MKIPIRSAAQLQRKIDHHVRSIELAADLFYDGHGPSHKGTVNLRYQKGAQGSLREVHQAVLAAGYPVDYRYVCQAIGFPSDTTHHWRVAQRLGWLVTRGYLRVAGRGEPRYHWKKGAQLFVAVPPDEVPIVRRRVLKAIDRMLSDVEPTSYLVNDVPLCLANRIQIASSHKGRRYSFDPARDAEIVRLRLTGMTLQTIGAKFGITRERARQIVERAVDGRPRRLPGRPRQELIAEIPAKDWPEAADELRDEQLALDIIKKQLDNR